MFAKVESSVTKSCQIFRRKNIRKNAILAWNFPLFCAGSLVVRESRHPRDRIFDKNSRKRRKNIFGGLRFFFKSGRAHPVFNGSDINKNTTVVYYLRRIELVHICYERFKAYLLPPLSQRYPPGASEGRQGNRKRKKTRQNHSGSTTTLTTRTSTRLSLCPA